METITKADNATDTEVKTTSTVDTGDATSEETQFVDGLPDKGQSDESQVDKQARTRAFSKRLNEKTQEIKTKAEADKTAELNEVAKTYGFNTWTEYRANQRQQQLESIGITNPTMLDTYINDAVSQNPVVKEAQRIIEEQKNKNAEETINNAVQEIHKLDESINSLEDLFALENYDDIKSLVAKGYSLSDAFKVASFDTITTKKTTQAAQNAVLNQNSKSHMQSTTGTHSNEASVPQDIMSIYKKNFPSWSDEDIRKDYNKRIKE